jgi:sugar transferase EpsL
VRLHAERETGRSTVRSGDALKRAVDIVVACMALIVAFPLMLIVAGIVAVSIGRPVLFRQERLGRRGVPFVLFKFRTMTDEREQDGTLLPDACRLTRVGRILRSVALDELPELVNVLFGDMSLVGPRPLLTSYRDRYSPMQWRRHEVRPGMAGPVVARGRNALSWDRKFELDVWYVDHRSAALDVRLLVLSMWKAATREGVNQPGRATVDEFEGSRN